MAVIEDSRKQVKLTDSSLQINSFEVLRKTEFSRLDDGGHIYLDYTGGNLYPASLIQKHSNDLLNGVYGNPHSANPTSSFATAAVESARKAVIDFFHADDYVCVFTQNATHALKLVGESYPFDAESVYILLADNHNSTNGIREFCVAKGGKTEYVPVQFEDLRISDAVLEDVLQSHSRATQKLFAFPAQSNVSGVKHDLKWIARAKELGYDVVLDAAAFVPTSPLDLSEVKPDFVALSFYKMFGYPTGIGCLLIHQAVYDKLQKPWFAGGTVAYATVASQKKILNSGHERFEDGTVNYLSIPAIEMGLGFLSSVGMERLQNRIQLLTAYLLEQLAGLQHANKRSLVEVFGPNNTISRGGTVLFNVYDDKGVRIPPDEVETAAISEKISFRTGCMCNPGVDEINNRLTSMDFDNLFVEQDADGAISVQKQSKSMRGAIRVSVGLPTLESDIDKLIALLRTYLR